MVWVKRILLTLLVLTLLLMGGYYYFITQIVMGSRDDYDTEKPVLPVFTKPAILVFSKTNGHIHEEAIPVGKQVFNELAAKQGWEAYVTDNGAVHSPELLKKFDIIIWNNVSGDVLTEEQRAALKQWIENGGGWLGIHGSGGDFRYQWDWYVDTLIGTQFVGHNMEPQFQDAHVLVADPANMLTSHLPSPWVVKQEEWYAFESSPRGKGYEILLTLDESSYHTSGLMYGFMQDRMEGEHPLAWRHTIGQGRALYSAIGHQPATFHDEKYQEFLVRSLHWLTGE